MNTATPEKNLKLSQFLLTDDNKPLKLVEPLLNQVLGLNALSKQYQSVAEAHAECQEEAFVDTALNHLGVKISFDKDQLTRIPEQGPTVVVANHPYGVHDALLMVKFLKNCGRPFKVMANGFFGKIDEVKDHLILVDAFKKNNKANSQPLREAMKWLRDGNVLAIFPAGAVSRFSIKKRDIIDPEWSNTVARLIRKTEATTLPIFFHGSNSVAFHLAGLAHPLLGTIRLPKEVLKKKKKIKIEIGKTISHKELMKKGDDKAVTDYLRMRCYLLQGANEKQKRTLICDGNAAPVSPEIPKDKLQADIDALPAEAKVLDYKNFSVYIAKYEQIPNILPEIGRQRELTFRAVGEGSGKAIDLDKYDKYYYQLFAWNNEEQEILGAYRIGEVDAFARGEKNKELYTSEFFKYSKDFLDKYQPGLELGRSFVVPKYQRKPYSLLLLWRGVCHYVAQKPHYRYLFGSVSVSNEYSSKSRALIAGLLQDKVDQVKARMPVNIRMSREVQDYCRKYHIDNPEELSLIVKNLEDDNKDIPILIKQYMKLGGKFMSFTVDKDFGNTLDGLIMVDLAKSPTKNLKMFMNEYTEDYQASHLK